MTKILLVEGDSMVSGIYQRGFIASGFECDVAASVKDALQKIAESKFDLVLLELTLPGENGVDVLDGIRANPASDPELKIIIFSDSSDRALHQRIINLGVNGFIAKLDYSPSRLIGEVNRFMHQFEEQRKNAIRFANGGVPIPKNKKLLLVEDEDVFVDMFGKRLRDEGYELDIAVDGAQGFQKASENTYDLIITDMVMPKLNGQELIAKLRENETTKDVPVFLFSASVGDDVLENMRCDGTRCFLKTHLTPSELTREVNKFLD